MLVGASLFMFYKIITSSRFDYGLLGFTLIIGILLLFRVLPLKTIRYDEGGLYISDVFRRPRTIKFNELDRIEKLYFLKHHYRIKIKKQKSWFNDIQFISPISETFGSFGKGTPKSLKNFDKFLKTGKHP